MTSLRATSERLRTLALFLQAHRPLWEERPFIGIPVSWEPHWPELSRVLRAIPESSIPLAEADPLGFLASQNVCGELHQQLVAYSTWDAINPHFDQGTTSSFCEPPRPPRVDGRKWSQISRFVACISKGVPTEVRHWVDWCAGKGHLGRTLNEQLEQPVTCVEINNALVKKGTQEAGEHSTVSFEQADVLSGASEELFENLLQPHTGVVALHACGNLNARLLQLAAIYQPAFLAIVPCCYQRIDGSTFTPMSRAARDTGLHLTRHQLRLPALDGVNSTEQQRLFRKREAAFRQGTDLLVRQATGKNVYTPLGKIPPEITRGDFETFARFAVNNVQAPLPKTVHWASAEKAGFEHLRIVSGLSISRQLFRRAIESWLFLDRIAFLQENGYHVTSGTFCHRKVTPRNLMILATKNTIP